MTTPRQRLMEILDYYSNYETNKEKATNAIAELFEGMVPEEDKYTGSNEYFLDMAEGRNNFREELLLKIEELKRP